MDRRQTEKSKNLASNSWHRQMTFLFGKCVRLETRARKRFWGCDRISFGHNPPTETSKACLILAQSRSIKECLKPLIAVNMLNR